MSTAEGYSIDAYCDVCGEYAQFYGTTRGGAMRVGRRQGWTLSNQPAPKGAKSIAGGKSARCPKHRNRGRADGGSDG